MLQECTLNTNLDEQIENITHALRNLKPSPKYQKHILFTKLYPLVVELIKANVTQKAILEVLEQNGLKLHPSRFKELMEAEAKAVNGRAQTGEASV